MRECIQPHCSDANGIDVRDDGIDVALFVRSGNQKRVIFQLIEGASAPKRFLRTRRTLSKMGFMANPVC